MLLGDKLGTSVRVYFKARIMGNLKTAVVVNFSLKMAGQKGGTVYIYL